MRIAESSLQEQSTHVDKTIHSFYQIRDQIKAVVKSIQIVDQTMQTVEKAKETLLITIESVSSMSEETAASVEIIRENFTEQLHSIQTLNDSCQTMQEQAVLLTSQAAVEQA
jgi:methyl-accepting chemotaxis protein